MIQQPNLQEEQKLQAQGLKHIAGIDEAGRGAWAGPVVAAAVVLPLERPDLARILDGVRDSKQCTPRQRDELFGRIQKTALDIGVGSVPPRDIDAIGIVPATQRAMTQAVKQLKTIPDALLIDALQLPALKLPQSSLIKGDARSLSIAAASIVAKVTRDRMMISRDGQYGNYGFAQHKGYGTRQHQQTLALLGLSPIHRLSYSPLRKLTGDTDEAIRVLTYNIHHWRGCDNRVDMKRLAKAIAQTKADIAGLNEVFHPLTTKGETRDLLTPMAARLGMAFVFGPTNSYSDWGYVSGPYGNGLLSRYPIRNTQNILLPKTEGHYRRAVLRAELAVGRETWAVYVTHLNHLSESVRGRETAALLEIIARFDDDFHLVMGDFNSPTSNDYVNTRVVPRMMAAGYVDAWLSAGGDGESNTWPAPCPQMRLDYLFVPPSLQKRLLSCRVPDSETARTASDHRPVLVELQ